MTLASARWAAGLAALAVATGGCGGGEGQEPTQADASAITASVNGIVEQCGSVEAGFLAGVDQAALQRDVDALIRASESLRPDAEYRIEGLPPELARTTVGGQVGLAQRKLRSCSPRLAEKLRAATEG